MSHLRIRCGLLQAAPDAFFILGGQEAARKVRAELQLGSDVREKDIVPITPMGYPFHPSWLWT